MRRMPDGGRDKPPLVVVEKTKGAMRLAALSEAARRAGLSVGLSLSDARVRVPDLWVEEGDRAADQALLIAVAEKCSRFSPVVMLDEPDGLLLDITGCDHLFGGEVALRQSVSDFFSRAGLNARIVIAGAPDSARALARFGSVAIVPPGSEGEAVRPLPVAALGLPEVDRVAIVRAGLKTIGSLADRPAALLVARFGEEAGVRLQRLLGAAPAPLTPFRVTPRLWLDRRFPEPLVSSDVVQSVLIELACDACAELSARREGGRVFEFSFYRSDGAIRRLVAESSRPSRDPSVLVRLFREKIETLADPLDPGFGFDLIRLSVLHAEPLSSAQSDLDGHAMNAEFVTNLADRLSARFGVERVSRFESVNTHDPSRVSRLVPAASEGDVNAWAVPASGEPPLRPLHMFPSPQPIDVSLVEVPDGPPKRFKWRRKQHDIVHAEGPETIAGEWWRGSDKQSRDYYRVEDVEGFRFWLFREGGYGDSPRWFVHGLFA